MPGPVITLVSPASLSDLRPDSAIVIDITDTDADLVAEFIYARVGRRQDDDRVVVWNSSEFMASFSGVSVRAAITNGFRYTIRRRGGWRGAVAIGAIAVDAAGSIDREL